MPDTNLEKYTGDMEISERVLDIIGPKWSLLITALLCQRPMRFGELRRELHDINPRTLTARLRELEEQEIVERTLYPEIPPRVEYSLTSKGRDLHHIVFAMERWGMHWLCGKRDGVTTVKESVEDEISLFAETVKQRDPIFCHSMSQYLKGEIAVAQRKIEILEKAVR